MSGLKLSMSVEVLPAFADGSRPELREARISVSSSANDGRYITLISDPDFTFKPEHVSAMLRLFADQVDRKYGKTKEAA